MKKTIQYLLFSQVLLLFFFTSHVEGLEAEGLVGGEAEDEIRYLVSVQLDNNHTCSGSIIAGKYVVTAAHCLIENKNNEFTDKKVKIVADVEDLLANEPARVEIDVEEIYIPSVYNGSHWSFKYPEGDIAVLKLKHEFDLTYIDGLKTLRLPKAGDGEFPQEYVMAMVSGYNTKEVVIGKYENGTEHRVESQHIFKADALVIGYDTCKQYWKSYVTGKNLCAKVVNVGHTIRGSCKGDSGSPLVYGGDLLIGVASGRASNCFKNAAPILYTRLASYIDFVESAMNSITENMRVKILSS